MFKKRLDLKPQQVLKGSERKKIQAEVTLPLPKTISKCHFQTNEIEKGTMYFNVSDNEAVYFQTRYSDLIPTVSILTLYPDLHNLPIVQTHEAVIDRLINGADLMIRGCVGTMPANLQVGKICVVVDYKRPLEVIAVGICELDVSNLNWNQYKDMKGVVVKIMNVIGDLVPSRGIDELLKERVARISDDDILKEIQGLSILSDEEEEEDEEQEELQEEPQEIETQILSQTIVDEIEEPNHEEEAYKLTTEDIDQFFERSLLYTISQDPIQLPIKSTQLIESHILKNLPNCDLDVVNLKKTSWRKGTKFLKAMEKSKLLKLKGKDDNLTVISLATKDDPRIANFHPYKIRSIPKPKPPPTSNENTNVVDELTLKVLYKPTNPARQLYNAMDLVYDQYYTLQEITKHVQDYIKKESLVSQSDKQMIESNPILKEFGIKKEIKRAAIMNQIMTKYSPYYLLFKQSDLNSNDPLIQKRLQPKKGTPPKIEISIERLKIGKRFITNVKHCELFYINPEELASQLRVKCMGSTNINDPLLNPKDGKEVVVQGKHDSTIVKLLKVKYGIHENWCVVIDNIKTKPRKK